MAFDDLKLGRLFPTREGVAIGTGPERVMLEATDGAANIKKRFQNNPDGSVTMLQTRNGWPEFTTIPGPITPEELSCFIALDSGVLDILGFGEADPNTLLPGVVYWTDYVDAHVNGQTTAVGSGQLDYPSDTGPVVADGTYALAYNDTTSSYATDFKDRKKLALKIPASLFTGRMRLYVQSLFGGNWPKLLLSQTGTGRPILSVSTKDRADAFLPATNIGSGCGIFFDDASKRHYLIIPTETQAFVVPLIGSPCAERFRLVLLASALSDADNERIEAYILSQSVPVPELAQILNYTSTPSEALGYSWHFNWSGDKCDIIDMQETNVSGYYGFQSTHYRLTFSLVGLNFEVARSIVSGPTFWTVGKNANVIAYPDWTNSRLVKAGNLPSGRTDISQSGDAYCFYAKDVLKIVSMEANPQTFARGRTSTPNSYGGTKYESWLGVIAGLESGSTSSYEQYAGYSVLFSCDGTTVGGVSSTRTDITSSHIYKYRTVGTAYDFSGYFGPASVWTTETGSPSFTVAYDANGTPSLSGTPTWSAVSFGPPVSISGGSVLDMWEYQFGTYTRNQSHRTLVAIPFFDAEAVILSGGQSVRTYGTNHIGNNVSSVKNEEKPFGGGYVPVSYSVVNGTRVDKYYVVYVESLGNEASSPSTVDVDTTTVSPDGAKIICAHGTLDATLPSEDSFYTADDYVSQFYTTKTSVNGAVDSPDIGVQVGSATYPALSAYIGWA